MGNIFNFKQFSKLFESNTSDLKSIIIGDSLTPLIAKNSKEVQMIGNVGSEANLWKSGVNTIWLKRAVEKFPITPSIINVFVKIGTNSGFNPNDDIKGLIGALRRTFPSAKLFVVQGSWGWGNNKNVTADKVKAYYSIFANEGVTVIQPPAGYAATSAEAHRETAAIKEIGKNIDIAIKGGGNNRIVPKPELTTSSIVTRPGDPYKYKVVLDHWLAKKDGQTKWYEITGADFKPAFQSSIDILDKENPELRSETAPKKGNLKILDPYIVTNNMGNIQLDPLLISKFPIKLSGSYRVPGIIPAKGDALHSFDRRKIDGFGGYMLRGGPIPNRWNSYVKLDQGKGINQVLKELISSGINPDVTNIKVTVNPDYSVNWEATIEESRDGKAYSGVATRGSSGSNADKRALEQIPSMKSKKTNAYNWKEVLDLNVSKPIKIRQYFLKYSER